MNRTKLFFAAAVLTLLLSNCAPSRFIKPLDKKQKAVSFSFGGPIIQFDGLYIPIPITTLCYGYGVSEKVTTFGSLHITSLLFGNIQTDLGFTGRVLQMERFGVSASPAFQIAYHVGNVNTLRLWPSLDLNCYFDLNKKGSYLYAGMSAWFELSKLKAYDEEQSQHVLPNLHCGYQLSKTKWQHQLELKYMGIGIPNTPGVTGYVGVGGKGSFGIYYSVTRKF